MGVIAKRPTGARVLVAIAAFAAALGVTAGAARADDGTLDPGFGTDGRATLDWPDGIMTVSAIALDSQGRIVVAGTAYPDPLTNLNPEFMVTRALPSGTLDPTFAADVGGFRRHAFDLAGAACCSVDEIRGVAVTPSDAIVVAGWALFENNTRGNAALIRLDATGAFDNAFAGDGTFDFAFPGAEKTVLDAIALDTSGRAVVSGLATFRPQPDGPRETHVLVARVTTEGALDATFAAPTGALETLFKAPVTPGYGEGVYSLALDAGSHALVGGASSDGAVLTGGVLRVDAAGALDTTFDADGRRLLDRPAYVTAIAPQPDGSVMLAGGADDGIYLARLTPTGALDPRFGDGGVARTLGPNAHYTFMMRTRAGGWLLAGADGAYGIALLRVTARGAPDTSLGPNGGRLVSYDDGANLFIARGFARTPDGDLLVAGALPEAAHVGVADIGLMKVRVDVDALFADDFDDLL